MKDYRPLLIRFSNEMERVLIENEKQKGKRGWETLSNEHILSRIEQETKEVYQALLNQESASKVVRECVDIANFCMMLADNIARRENEKYYRGDY